MCRPSVTPYSRRTSLSHPSAPRMNDNAACSVRLELLLRHGVAVRRGPRGGLGVDACRRGVLEGVRVLVLCADDLGSACVGRCVGRRGVAPGEAGSCSACCMWACFTACLHIRLETGDRNPTSRYPYPFLSQQAARNLAPSHAVLTEPIDMKNAKVAADEPMYWARVARAPRGPGPALSSARKPQQARQAPHRRMENEPCHQHPVHIGAEVAAVPRRCHLGHAHSRDMYSQR